MLHVCIYVLTMNSEVGVWSKPPWYLQLTLERQIQPPWGIFDVLCCQAANCTLVTSSLRLVDKRSRSWLQRSYARLRGVTGARMKRRGFAKKDGSAVEEDSTLYIFRRIRLVCFQVSLCVINIFLSFSALIVLIFASRCARVTACDSHQLSLCQAGCKWCHFQHWYPRWCHSFRSAIEEMPAGLLGGVCKGRKEDRDGVWNWQDSGHEGVGGQCLRKGFLVLVYAK